MTQIVLDTNVISHMYRGDLPARVGSFIDECVCLTTFVTVAELYQGSLQAAWGSRRIAELERLLHDLVVLPYDAGVSIAWAAVVTEARRKGRPTSANDAWIAACCVARELPLLTFNRRDFETFEALTLVSVE